MVTSSSWSYQKRWFFFLLWFIQREKWFFMYKIQIRKSFDDHEQMCFQPELSLTPRCTSRIHEILFFFSNQISILDFLEASGKFSSLFEKVLSVLVGFDFLFKSQSSLRSFEKIQIVLFEISWYASRFKDISGSAKIRCDFFTSESLLFSLQLRHFFFGFSAPNNARFEISCIFLSFFFLKGKFECEKAFYKNANLEKFLKQLLSLKKLRFLRTLTLGFFCFSWGTIEENPSKRLLFLRLFLFVFLLI